MTITTSKHVSGKHTMIDEYFQIYQEKQKEYGENTVILYQVGSFFECYRVETENLGNADKVSEILHILYSNKNKQLKGTNGSTRSFPDFCGFTISYLSKYAQMLLEANYTVIVVEQLEESNNKKETTTRNLLVKRNITHIYSPSLPPIEDYTDDQHLVSFALEQIKDNIILSTCYFNNSTNTSEILETTCHINVIFDEINRMMYKYTPKEILFHIISTPYLLESKYKFEKLGRVYIHDTKSLKMYTRVSYQNEFLKNVFKHIKFGLLEPIEYFHLHTMPLSILNYMFILEFIGKHDQHYITNLTIPTIIKEEQEHLMLELNTLDQLNIFPSRYASKYTSSTSIFQIINFTKTAIGKRALKRILSQPYHSSNTIQQRYIFSKELENIIDSKPIHILLDKIQDIEYYHRKMSLFMLHPFEFKKLDKNYHTLLELYKILETSQDNIPELYTYISNIFDQTNLDAFIKEYTSVFNIDEMDKFNLNNPNMACNESILFFKPHVMPELDTIQTKISTIQSKIEQIRKEYDSYINPTPHATEYIKMYYTDQEGYQMTCTKIRYQSLIKKLSEQNNHTKTHFHVKTCTNTCKFTSDELVKLSRDLVNNTNLLIKKIKLHYITKLQEYYEKYDTLFHQLKYFIEIIDITYSNVKCKQIHHFCEPTIDLNSHDSHDSHFNAIGLWHPIVEQLGNYCIPNDVTLTSETLGILLYGINAAGKSTLLRSVGICIILAQAGLYVPCKSFTFSPFKTIISQVDLSDDIFKNKSSFIVEMTGLKCILRCANPNTLVLSDELCKGTENYSAMGIVCSTILYLLEHKTKFFFTTHLHHIQTLNEIATHPQLNICHLEVTIKNGDIIFDRILKPGSGNDLYGIEISKAILNNSQFIDKAFEIRNKLTNKKKTILSTKKSTYNSKKIVDHCEICHSDKLLETHHISPQIDTDDKGFVNNKHFHKNKLYNLATLCKTCHDQVTYNKIIIHGYKQSSSGKFLDYIHVDNTH